MKTMEGKYGSLTVQQLKKELVTRGAATSGRKLDLVERLEAYDRNQNFKSDPIILPEPLSADWPTAGFRQLVEDHKNTLPKITSEQIETYFIFRLADDRQSVNDVKAIVKGRAMYESNRILACSINNHNDVYLTGMVAAAMKQKVTYSYKIRIDRNTGDPLNSHCECPAGRVPHGTCKHIAAVCLMMEDFTQNGKIRVAKSATENLMSFNKPKSSYRGSPVKAENLPSKRKFASEFLDDPRPLKYRNDSSFNDRVRNIVTNYCSQTSKDLPIRYLYSRADIQAASKDHFYCSLPLTENIVDSAIMVDENKAKSVEIATRGQSRNPIWFQERMWRLTASRFGEICKSTCRRNTTKLCNSLLNSNFQSQAILHGKNYEKKALKQFEMENNVVTSECGLFVCIEHPFLGASPDAIVDDLSIVEVKCPFTGRNKSVKPGPNFKYLMYDGNGNTVLKPSSNYYDQVQGQLYIANRSFCFFVVYTFCDMFVQKIYIDRNYVENCLLPKLKTFYEKYFRP